MELLPFTGDLFRKWSLTDLKTTVLIVNALSKQERQWKVNESNSYNTGYDVPTKVRFIYVPGEKGVGYNLIRRPVYSLHSSGCRAITSTERVMPDRKDPKRRRLILKRSVLWFDCKKIQRKSLFYPRIIADWSKWRRKRHGKLCLKKAPSPQVDWKKYLMKNKRITYFTEALTMLFLRKYASFFAWRPEWGNLGAL